jgi:hypothetical protein
MSVTLVILALASVFVVAFFVARWVTHGFKGWTFAQKLAVLQTFLPFAAAAFALNALFGNSIDTASTIAAAVLTLASGLVAIVNKVAATLDSLPHLEFAEGRGAGFGDVLNAIFRS